MPSPLELSRGRWRVIFVLLDFALVSLSCAISIFLSLWLGESLNLPFLGRGAVITTPMFGLVWILSFWLNSVWDLRLATAGTEYYVRVFRGTLHAFGAFGLVGFACNLSASRPLVAFGLPVGLLVMACGRWGFRFWWRRNAKAFKTGILASEPEKVFAQLSYGESTKVDLVGFILPSSPIEIADRAALMSIEVLVIDPNHNLEQHELRELIWILSDLGIEVWFENSLPFIRAGRSISIPTESKTVFILNPLHLSTSQKVLKRALDIFGALIAIVILAPVLAVALCVIYVVDGRPLFFQQIRVGQYGENFRLWKLCTMRGDKTAVEENRPHIHQKTPFDPRITQVGRILRKWSIDEIPQLINVLGGSMSLVGPRPRLSHEISSNPRATRRLQAKPGLTGPWQTSGRAEIPLDEAESIDLAYVDGWTILGDIVLVVRTVKAVLTRRGAY